MTNLPPLIVITTSDSDRQMVLEALDELGVIWIGSHRRCVEPPFLPNGAEIKWLWWDTNNKTLQCQIDSSHCRRSDVVLEPFRALVLIKSLKHETQTQPVD